MLIRLNMSRNSGCQLPKCLLTGHKQTLLCNVHGAYAPQATAQIRNAGMLMLDAACAPAWQSGQGGSNWSRHGVRHKGTSEAHWPRRHCWQDLCHSGDAALLPASGLKYPVCTSSLALLTQASFKHGASGVEACWIQQECVPWATCHLKCKLRLHDAGT